MTSTQVLRILDASLNRASEGLRVVEDYTRFVLDDRFLTTELKRLRHNLASAAATIPSADRHAARDTLGDVGPAVAKSIDAHRTDAWDVCSASLKRVEQSLRSLEEYGKLFVDPFAEQMETARYRLYTLEKSLDIGRTSRERLATTRLCVLVDGRRSKADFERFVNELVESHACMIQLRDKHLDDCELVGRARALVAATRQSSHTLAIINDRADIAAAVNADGVHLGQEDISLKDARMVVGPQMLIGVSTHNIDQARRAVLDGANYLGVGPTFPSTTKQFEEFAGLNYLRQVASEIGLPAFAIGGITSQNLPQVQTAGISRIAVSSAVTGAAKPACAARQLLDMLNDAGDPRPAVAAL